MPLVCSAALRPRLDTFRIHFNALSVLGRFAASFGHVPHSFNALKMLGLILDIYDFYTASLLFCLLFKAFFTG